MFKINLYRVLISLFSGSLIFEGITIFGRSISFLLLIFTSITGFFLIRKKLIHRLAFYYFSRHALLILLFVFIGSLGFFAEPSINIEMSIITNWLTFFLLLIGLNEQEDDLFQVISKYFILGLFFASLFIFLGIGVEYIQNRLQFFGVNSNELASKYSMGIILLFVNKDRYKTFLINIITVLFIMVIFLTGSRTFLLISLAIILIQLYSNLNNLIFLSVLLFISISSFFFISKNLDFLLDLFRFTEANNINELGGRLDFWKFYLDQFLQNPFGTGRARLMKNMQNEFGFYESAHNVLLEVSAITGILGLLLTVSILFKPYLLYKQAEEKFFLFLFIWQSGLFWANQAFQVKIYWFSIFLIILFFNKKYVWNTWQIK